MLNTSVDPTVVSIKGFCETALLVPKHSGEEKGLSSLTAQILSKDDKNKHIKTDNISYQTLELTAETKCKRLR